jgi:hypothetical protein
LFDQDVKPNKLRCAIIKQSINNTRSNTRCDGNARGE